MNYKKKPSIRAACGELRSKGERQHVLQPYVCPVAIGNHKQTLTLIPGWAKRSAGTICIFATRYAPPEVWFQRWLELKHISTVYDDNRVNSDVIDLLRLVNSLHRHNPSKPPNQDSKRLWWSDIWRELGLNALNVFALLEYCKCSAAEKATYPVLDQVMVALADAEKKYNAELHKQAAQFCEAAHALAVYVKCLNERSIQTIYDLGDALTIAKAGTSRTYWAEAELSGSLLDGYQQQLAFSTHSQLVQAPVSPVTDDLYARLSRGTLDETKTRRTASCEVQQSVREAEEAFKAQTGKEWSLDHKFDVAVARVARIPGQGYLVDPVRSAVRNSACPPGQCPGRGGKLSWGLDLLRRLELMLLFALALRNPPDNITFHYDSQWAANMATGKSPRKYTTH